MHEDDDKFKKYRLMKRKSALILKYKQLKSIYRSQIV